MLGKTVKMIVWKSMIAGALAAIVFAALVDCANPAGGSGSSTPSLSLNSTKQDLVIGLNPYQLTATVSPAGSAVAWSSSNTAVATVSTTGLVTPVALGSATITATSGTLTATCAVTSNVFFVTGNAQVSTSNTGYTVPVYWYNGTLMTLPTGSQPYGQANGYWIKGSDIYIGGNTWDASGNNTCVYWKNGTLTTLTPPSGVTYRGDYESIEFDSSGNSYMRGSFTNTLNGNSNNSIPGYWYNGVFTALSMTLPNGSTATSGSAGSGDYLNTANGANDYYVNGYLVDPTTNLQVPVYWKNGVVNVVPMGSIATASVNGGSVQAILPSPDMASLTALITGNDAHWNSIPAYVINGTVTPISTGSYSNGVAWFAWTTSSGDIYAEGELGNSTNFWGTGNSYYWKNWVLTLATPPTLPGAGGNSLTCNSLNSLNQIGNQVVFSAIFSNINGLNSAVYWIQGGAATVLPVGGYAGGSVSGFGYLNFVPTAATGSGTIGTTINSIGRTK